MQNKYEIIIIGAGPVGLSSAYHMNSGDYMLFEKESELGGLMRSKNIDGFVFDYAGHIFFTNIDWVRKFINDLMRRNFVEKNRSAWIFSKNVYTQYPFQSHTYGLPKNVIKDCVIGLIKSTWQNKKNKSENFYDWILNNFGQGIAEHFMLPYNEKLWKIPLCEIDCGWIESRVPQPDIEKVIDGALGKTDFKMGGNAVFNYPEHGGCASIVSCFEKKIKNYSLGKRVTKIFPNKKEIEINNKEIFKYDKLILSNPLPEILDITQGLPEELLKLKQEFKYISILCVNLGINREKITDKNWIYFPEQDFIFHRVFVQSNTSKFVCPPDTSSYIVEISYLKDQKLSDDVYMQKTLKGLKQTDLLKDEDEILVKDIVDIPYAYVVPIIDKDKKVGMVRDYLKSKDIYLAGRYSEWEYYNMDHAIARGKGVGEW